MSNNFLEKILKYKKELLGQKRSFYESLRRKTQGQKFSRYHIFKEKISRPGQLNLIAEIKKASPSRGLIRKEFDVLALAKIYVNNHAVAISVVTEDKFFLGKLTYARQISENFDVPILIKDFIIDEVQIYEAFVNGASAILLIMAILDDVQFSHLYSVARSLDLDCLVEVHNEEELSRALRGGSDIIGINNRNLETFEVSLDVSRSLIPAVPKGKTIVVESGIKSHADIEEFYRLGANAVLIGEAFMEAPDVDEKIKEIMTGKIS